MKTSHQLRAGMRALVDDVSITTIATEHPGSPQNRFINTWVDFAAEHLDVDRPGDN